MKTLQILTVAILFIGFTSCSSDDDNIADLVQEELIDDNDDTTTPDPTEEELVDGDDNTTTPDLIETALISNLEAPQTGGQGTEIDEGGPFTKFDFETGAETTSDTDWDIAFRGTTIAVNGGTATGTNDEPARNGEVGVAIETGTFADITTAEGLLFEQDSSTSYAIPTGSDNGWYNYNFMTNVVLPIPGKILVFKTRNGNYAKIEILSYYQDAPDSPDGFVDTARYYTFNYMYNPNEGDISFE